MHRILIALFLFLFPFLTTRGQVDSLRIAASKASSDTAKASVYLAIARSYYNNEGQLDSSFIFYDRAARIFERNAVPSRFAKALNGKALIEREKGVYKEALEYALQALSIAEKCHDTAQITASLNGIAIVNQIQQDYDKAYEYYQRCERIHLKTGNILGLASIYNNLGLLFSEKKRPDRSLQYFTKALALNEKSHEARGIATNCENIGLHYLGYDHDPSRALQNFSRSIGIWRSMNDKNSVAITLDYITSALLDKGEYRKAVDSASLSLQLAGEAGSIYSQRQAHEKLYQLFEKLHDTGKAFDHYKQFIVLRDSLKNDDKLREITQMQLKYEFARQKEVDDIRQRLEQKTLSDEIGKQRTIIFAFIALLAILTIAGVLIWRSYRINKLARKKIALQKTLLEEQNKNIVDSIKYAKHIQEAIMPPAEDLQKKLPEHFVLYKPKDIVSGDFYWLHEKNDKIYFAVVDCTGHGVPGAFMSIVGSNGLNEALNVLSDPSPSEVLNFLNNHVNNTLNQTIDNSTIRDGMDLSLCVFDFKNRKLSFAGANNPLWIFNNNRKSWPAAARPLVGSPYAVMLPPDKHPIGNFIGLQSVSFSEITMDLVEDDLFILLTDGYADQFGGPKGKKFKYKQLQKKILGIQHLALAEQRHILEETLDNWRGSQEQVDDICIIGIRIRK